jgi:predicted PurR-regulated permease PerM
LFADPKPYNLDRVVRLVLSVLALAALLWLVGAVSEVLIPLAIAFLLAYLLNPIVGFTQRWISNRVAAVLTTVSASLLLLAVLAYLLLPVIAGEMVGFGRLLAGAVGEDSNLQQWARQHLPENIAAQIAALRNSDELRAFLDSDEFKSVMNGAQSISGLLVVSLKWTISRVWGVVSGLFGLAAGVAGLFIILLYVVFLLIDYRKFQDTWKDYLPPKYREEIVAFLNEFNAAMSRYFRGQFLVAACVGVLFAVGFKIMGLKLAIALGLFIGMLNMVPYLQTAGVLPAVLLAVMTAFEKQGSVLTYLVGVAVVFIVVQTIQDAVLTPRIMGKVTGLRPAVILFSVLFWGKLLGFLGLVVAIPLTCLGLAYYRGMLARQETELGSSAKVSTAETS